MGLINHCAFAIWHLCVEKLDNWATSRAIHYTVKTIILFLLWCVLFVLCWPLALAVLLVLPILWLLLIPFRVFAWAVEALLALIKGLLFLPARILGGRSVA